MLAADLLALGAATLGECGARPLQSRLRPVWAGATLAGPAFTAACAAGDNLAIHLAVAESPTGAVLVVDASADRERGNWGEVLTTGAQASGIGGLVIDGGVRDVAALQRLGFPVFSDRIALPGASKRDPGVVGATVTVGNQAVSPGDWVVGDVDGVVVIDADAVDEVLAAARQRATNEEALFEALRAGATTVDLLGLRPSPPGE